MCQIFSCSVIQGVSFNYHQRNVRSRVSVSNFQVSVSVSSRHLSQVSVAVSEVTVSTTSLESSVAYLRIAGAVQAPLTARHLHIAVLLGSL